MTPADIIPWLTLFLSSVAVFGVVKGWMSSGEKEMSKSIASVRKDVDAQTTKLTDHDRRIQSVETEMKHLPNRETAHALELALSRINGRLDTMDERLKPLAATTHRLQEYLMEQVPK